MSPDSVNQVFRDVEQLVRAHASIHENEFTATPLSEDIGVKIHGTELIQVLVNLVVNAFQCSPEPHWVEVGGEVLRKPLDLTTFKDGLNDRFLNGENMDNTAPLVRLWVCDNGPGIPPEILPKIFFPYFTTREPRRGMGLGLAIVERLIKEAGGALHVHTRQGKGTIFTIYLPAEVPAR